MTEHGEHGLFGGYLVLNSAARPLEFHCTAPVRPNRAQEILFGPTLKPYLYGEQIAHTLITKARQTPLLIFTDVVHVLDVRPLIEIPVVHLASGTPAAGNERSLESAAERAARNERPSDAPVAASDCPRTEYGRPAYGRPDMQPRRLDDQHHRPPGSHLPCFRLGQFPVAVSGVVEGEQSLVSRLWAEHLQGVDLEEPFERIRGAIQEAQRAAR
ncbi:MAG: hypothetical protein J5I93_27115 [Pirellulaceae bacterium]|nr:hypothetical protein [Pirellulaceae bacterium]